ncbi:MAG: type II toxin-antitoxin system RelE/ParE family toxin [Nitrospira sp.]|nr:type II toxin-antitoxin system RelE/ParE family toxin [Nitrospira sp.]
MTEARFLLPAEEEMIAAAQYYEHKSLGLGAEFLTEVERVTASIAAHPEAAPKVKGKIRRRLLKRFPFGVLYVASKDEIVVVAIMHLSRRPGYWADRVRS